MLTSRGVGLLGAAVVIYASARAFGITELQLTAVAAVGLVVAAVLFSTLTSARLQVVRTVHPTRLHHGAEARSTLVVTNTGRLPTAALELEDRIDPVLARAAHARLRPLAAGGTVTLRTRVDGARRGRHQLGPLRVVLRDPFRLVARRQDLDAAGEIVVLPQVVELPGGLPLGGAQATSGSGAPRPLATGEDRSTVREYVQGDDLRGVHWPSTAHRGKLMVRQAEAPQDPRAVVVLDRRSGRHDPAGAPGSFETSVVAAASALVHLDRRGRGVVLVDGPLTGPVAPRPSDAWLAHLAETAPSTVDLPAVWRQLAKGAAGDGALLVVLPPPDADELRDLVRAGRSFGTCTAVLVRRGAGGATRGGPDAESSAAALRAAGWRTTVVTRPDELPVAWYELTVDRPRTSATSTLTTGTSAVGVGRAPGPTSGRDAAAAAASRPASVRVVDGPPPPPRELR